LNNMPDADYFDSIEVMPHEEDFTLWKVVGIRNETNAVKSTVLQDTIPNKALAEAFVRWYTDKYWLEMLSGAQDC
jgi:hypothetical protein